MAVGKRGKRRIAVIPGDGIGPEVCAEALRVLGHLGRKQDLPLTFESFDFGAERYLKTGVGLPPGQIDTFRRDFDAILFGAVGDPRVPGQAHAKEILLGLRFGLDLFVNFRPCRLLADRFSPLKGKGRAEVDFVVFRENTEGLYAGSGGFLRKGTADEVAIAEEVHTRKGVERIIRAAFDWAVKNKKGRVAMGDKSNAVAAHELWARTFKEVASDYPGIESRHLYADAMAMEMVLHPERFDVIVTNNLIGDLLTDLGSALAGGLGLAPSANLNPQSTPLFEPVHGSAPDIAGKGIANPFAMILTCALMLEELGLAPQSVALVRAVESAIDRGKVTPDLGGGCSTSQAADAVLEAM